MKLSAAIAVALAALLSGCGTLGGSVNSWAKPIDVKVCGPCDRMTDPDCGPPVCDLLTEESAQNIEDHNETGARIEGW